MKKKLIGSIVLLVIVIGCIFIIRDHSKKAVPELDKIQSDIEQNYSLDMFINKTAIISRKTDTDNKKDYIVVQIEAENEDVVIERQYAVEYHLYDDGWQFEGMLECNEESWSAIPKKLPSEELLAEHTFGESLDYEYDLENREACYYYTKTKEYENWTQVDSTRVDYTYSIKDLKWEYVDNEVMIQKDFHIDGTWEAEYVGVKSGLTAVYNENFHLRADISVSDDVAKIHIYPYGEHTDYFNGDKYYEVPLDPREEGYRTEKEEYSCTYPGQMPVSVYTYLYISSDEIGLNGMHLMKRVSE